MQVTCEYCQSTYEMDKTELVGRGVRITCPDCSHVFIVYQENHDDIEIDFNLDELLESLNIDESEIDDIQTISNDSLNSKELISEKMDSSTGQQNAEDFLEIPDEQVVVDVLDDVEIDIDLDEFDIDFADSINDSSKNQQNEVELGKKSSDTSTVNEHQASELQASSGKDTSESADFSEPFDEPAITEEEIASLDVNTLNFQEVGLPVWKVKNTIGLVFDFQDYKSIHKWMRESRIQPSDSLSHDNVNWVPIHSIDNLERYFCRVYLEYKNNQGDLSKRLLTEEKPKRVSERHIPVMKGMDDLVSALAEAEAEVDQTNAHNQKAQNKQKRPMTSANRNKQPNNRGNKSTPAKAGNSKNPKNIAEPPKKSFVPNLLVGAILLGAGWFFFVKKDDPTPIPVNNQAVTEDSVTEAELSAAKIRESIEQSAREQAKIREEDEKANQKPVEESRVVVPADAELQNTVAENVVVAPKKINNAEEGEKALGRQQYAQAATYFQKAYTERPLPQYRERWGYALYKEGKLAVAKPILVDASNKGVVDAKKWLGYILREEGDIASSNKYFQEYLQSNPRDAKQIQQEMKKR